MARKSKAPIIRKFVTVAIILIALQVGFLLVFRDGDSPKTSREAISKAIDKQTGGLSNTRREMMKVQAALADFRAKNNRFPAALQELSPVYFEKVPVNPTSGEPFEYRIEGVSYRLGSPEGEIDHKSGEGVPVSSEEKDLLIASLDPATARAHFVYDPTGKRDPFMPFDLSPKRSAGATPLEQYAFEELKVTAILNNGDTPKAIIEDSTGKGFTVGKGTKVGLNGGEIVEILPNKVVILESETDFTGEKKNRTTELLLRRPGLPTH